MSQVTAGGRDARTEQRKGVDLPVIVCDSASRVEGEIHFDVRDLSVGGAFLRSDLLFEVGEELQLTFQLPGDAEVKALGRVVHVVREAGADNVPGMGISFTRLSERDRDAVRGFLARS